MTDMVNHPPHYTSTGIECIDYMEQVLTPQEFIGYLRGQIIKYQHRLLLKGAPKQDAEKLAWYADRLVVTLDAQAMRASLASVPEQLAGTHKIKLERRGRPARNKL